MHIVIARATTKSNTKRYSLKANKTEYFLKIKKIKQEIKGQKKSWKKIENE